MKTLIVVALLGALLGEGSSIGNLAQPQSDLVLQVNASNISLVPKDNFEYLYLRVRKDRTAECEAIANKNHTKATFKKTLKDEDFRRLTAELENPSLLNARAQYETKEAILDSWTTWEIDIHHPEKIQTIRLVQFSPGMANWFQHPYPESVARLGCIVEKVRNDVTQDPAPLSAACEKILQHK